MWRVRRLKASLIKLGVSDNEAVMSDVENVISKGCVGYHNQDEDILPQASLIEIYHTLVCVDLLK